MREKKLAEIFGVFEHLLTENPIVKIHNTLDSSRPY